MNAQERTELILTNIDVARRAAKYYFAKFRRFFVRSDERTELEEFYGCALLGITRAAQSYDQKRGAFSAHAWFKAHAEIYLYMQWKQKNSPFVEIPLPAEETDEEGQYLAPSLNRDMLYTVDTHFESVEYLEDAKEYVKMLKPREAYVLLLRYNNHTITQAECAARVSARFGKCSQQVISRIITRLQVKYRTYQAQQQALALA